MNAKVETKPTKIVGNVRGFKNQKTVERATNIAVYIILAVLSIIWLAPIVWLILDSLRIESTGRVSYFIPQQFGFDNYIQLFTDPRIPYLQWFLNTFIVAIFTSLISTIIVLLTSYTFSRLRFKGRQGMMKLLMILGMFPGFMAMIAIYFILKGIGLLPSGSEQVPISNYLISLILVNSSGAAMGYLVSKGYFDTISKSIDEAAEIDGANKAQIFFKIILPLSKPILIFTALTSFMGPWGDYIFVATITRQRTDAWTIARGLYNMLNGQGMVAEYYTMFAAGAVLISIPITLLFIWMQKYYVSGVTGGAVKG
ncbi:MAG: sugar ABC transporter permease [Bacilli bacterium]|jgi:arabinogalactan oligomer/maltooligosaccharide transport system permease protein|nr:sugar ABC transporter permease [Bacilli bacterium]HNY74553.1 sugar ABC transporter permease [Bacilli bacterium]